MEEANRFKQQMKANCGDLVKKLKPKQFYYAYPSLINTNEYYRNGWHNSETLKTDFEISSNLTKLIVFMATYNSYFSKPHAFPNNTTWEGETFVPQVVDHGDDPLLFLGSNIIDGKAILNTNTETYGMGGDDTFWVMTLLGFE